MTQRFFFPVAAVLFALLFCASTACAADGPNARPAEVEGTKAATESLRRLGKAFSEISKKASPAVVFIKVEKISKGFQGMEDGTPMNDPFDLFNDEFFRRFFEEQDKERPSQRDRFRQMGQGSGFITSEDGYILTNNHVVGDVDRIMVKLFDEREFEARLVGKDPKTDIAVIKIEAKGLPTAALGNSENLEVGEWVLAVGNPFGLSHTITAGIVSATGRSSVGIVDYENFIQTDAAINPGNSGGPLLNLSGEVVGMSTAIFSRSGGYMGIGFAIPINMVMEIQSQLVKSGSVTRGYLGIHIKDLSPELAEGLEVKEGSGVLVENVVEGSPADKAGMRRGDLIVELDGARIDKVVPFRNRVAMIKPDSKALIAVMRDGKRELLEVIMGKQQDKEGVAGTQDRSNRLGFVVAPLTRDLAGRLGYPENEQGVVIERVSPSSNAAQAGLRPGILIQEVNRVRVRSVQDFNAAIEKSGGKPYVILLVREGGLTKYTVLHFEK